MSDPGHRPSFTRRKKIIFSILTVSLLLLLFEGALSLTGVGFGWEIDAPMAFEQLRAYIGKTPLWSDEDLLEANFSIYRDDRKLLWRLRGRLDLDVRNFLVPADLRGDRTFTLRTDGDGFRGPRTLRYGCGSRIVLCMGGSNTFGWGLTEGEPYPERLAHHLEKGAKEPFLVLNRGQPGYSSRQGIALWEGRCRTLSPAWVVLAFGFNDGIQAPQQDETAMASRGGPIGATRHALAGTRTYRLLRRLVFSAKKRSSPDPASLGPRVPRPCYRTNMETLVTAVRKAGGEPILVAIECKYPHVLHALAEDLDVPLVDADAIAGEIREEFEDGGGDPAWREAIRSAFPVEVLEKEPSWWVKADVAHYNAFVHDRVAQAIARVILCEEGG